MQITCGKSWDGAIGRLRRRGGGGLATLKASQARSRMEAFPIRRDFTERGRRFVFAKRKPRAACSPNPHSAPKPHDCATKAPKQRVARAGGTAAAPCDKKESDEGFAVAAIRLRRCTLSLTSCRPCRRARRGRRSRTTPSFREGP